MNRLIRRHSILFCCATIIMGGTSPAHALRPFAYSCQDRPQAAADLYLPDIVPSAEAHKQYAKENDKGDEESALNWRHAALFYFFAERFDDALYCLNRAYTIYSAKGNWPKALDILQRMYGINHYKNRFLAAAYIAREAAKINVRHLSGKEKETARWWLLEVRSLLRCGRPQRAASKALEYGKQTAEWRLWYKAEQFFEEAYRYYEREPGGISLEEIKRQRDAARSQYEQEADGIERIIQGARTLARVMKRIQASTDKYVHIARKYEYLGNEQEAARYYFLASKKYMAMGKSTLPASARFAVKSGLLNTYLGNLAVAREDFFAASDRYALGHKYEEAVTYAEYNAWLVMLTERTDKVERAVYALLRASANSDKNYQYAMSVIYSAITGELNAAQENIREAIKRYLRLAAMCNMLHMDTAVRFCYRRAIEIGKDGGCLDILPEIWLEYDGKKIRTEQLKHKMLKIIFEVADTMDIKDFPYQAFLGTTSSGTSMLHGLVRQFAQRQKVKKFLSRQA